MSVPISRALRAGAHTRLAVVGAGGKTSAIFLLARQLEGKVLVSASTHFAPDQVRLGDRHIELGSGKTLAAAAAELVEGVNVLTGPLLAEEDRIQGLSRGALDALHSFAQENSLPLLLEADGSRRRPLKAPAEHEPAIPHWVTDVLVVAGMSGIGRPLDERSVHRPGLFSALTGRAPGEIVAPADVVRLLSHPDGGMKAIPSNSRRTVLLNQADTPELVETGWAMSRGLLESYHSVLVGSLQQEKAGRVLRVANKIAGVVLAAGSSERYGQPKQLLDYHGKPFIRKVVENAFSGGLFPVFVVIGAVRQEIVDALAGLPVEFIQNPAWDQGQSTSLALAVQSLPGTISAAVFLLSDQPQITQSCIGEITTRYSRTMAPAVVPFVRGRRANPVLFDQDTFQRLSSVAGDQGGRALLESLPFERIDWQDDRLAYDVDTPEDYRRLIEETAIDHENCA